MSVHGPLQPIFAVSEFISNNPFRLNKLHSLSFLFEFLQVFFFALVPHEVLLSFYKDASPYTIPFLRHLRWPLLTDLWAERHEFATFLTFFFAIIIGITSYLSLVLGQSLSPFTKHSLLTRSLQFCSWLFARPLLVPLSLLFLSHIISYEGVRVFYPATPFSFSPTVMVAAFAFCVLIVFAFFYNTLVFHDDLMSKKWWALTSSYPLTFFFWTKVLVIIMFTLMYGRYRHEARLLLSALTLYASVKCWLRLYFFYFVPNAIFVSCFFSLFLCSVLGIVHGLTLGWSFSTYLPLIGLGLGVFLSIVISIFLYRKFRYYVPKSIPVEFLTDQSDSLGDKKPLRIITEAAVEEEEVESADFDSPFEIELKSRFLFYRPWRFWRDMYDSITDARASALDVTEAVFEYGCDLFGAVPDVILNYCRFVLYRRLDTKYVLLQIHAIANNSSIQQTFFNRYVLFCLHTRSRRLNATAELEEQTDDGHHASIQSLDSIGSAGSSLASFNSTGGSSSTRAHRFHLLALRSLTLFWLSIMPKSFAISKISSYTYDAITARRSALRLYGKIISTDARVISGAEGLSQDVTHTLKLYAAFLSDVCHEDHLGEQAYTLAELDNREAELDESDDDKGVKFAKGTKHNIADVSTVIGEIVMGSEQLESKKNQSVVALYKAVSDTINSHWYSSSDVLFRRHPMTIPDAFELRNKDRRFKLLPKPKSHFITAFVLLSIGLVLGFVALWVLQENNSTGFENDEYFNRIGRNHNGAMIPVAAGNILHSLESNDKTNVMKAVTDLEVAFSGLILNHGKVMTSLRPVKPLLITLLVSRNDIIEQIGPRFRTESELDIVADVSASILLVSSRIRNHYDVESDVLESSVVEVFSSSYPEEYATVLNSEESDDANFMRQIKVQLTDIIQKGQLLTDSMSYLLKQEGEAISWYYSMFRIATVVLSVFPFTLGVLLLIYGVLSSYNSVHYARNEIFHVLSNEMPSVITEVLAGRYKQALVSLPGGKTIAMDLAKLPDEGVDTSVDGREGPAVSMSDFSDSVVENESCSYVGPAAIDNLEHWGGTGPEDCGVEPVYKDHGQSEELRRKEIQLLNLGRIKRIRKFTRLLVLLLVVLFSAMAVLIAFPSSLLTPSIDFSNSFLNIGQDPLSRPGHPSMVFDANSLFHQKEVNVILSKMIGMGEFSSFSQSLYQSVIQPQKFIFANNSKYSSNLDELNIAFQGLNSFKTTLTSSTLSSLVSKIFGLSAFHLVNDEASRLFSNLAEDVLAVFVRLCQSLKVSLVLKSNLIDSSISEQVSALDVGEYGSLMTSLEDFEWDFKNEYFYRRDVTNYPERMVYSKRSSDLSKSYEAISELSTSLVTDLKILDEFKSISSSLSSLFSLLEESSTATSDNLCSRYTFSVDLSFVTLASSILLVVFSIPLFIQILQHVPILTAGPGCNHVSVFKILQKQKSIRLSVFLFLWALSGLFLFRQRNSCFLNNEDSNHRQLSDLIVELDSVSRNIAGLNFYSHLYITRTIHTPLADSVITSYQNLQKSLKYLSDFKFVDDSVSSFVSHSFDHIQSKLDVIVPRLDALSKLLFAGSYLYTEHRLPHVIKRFDDLNFDYDFSLPQYKSLFYDLPESLHPIFTSRAHDFNQSSTFKHELIDDVITGGWSSFLNQFLLFEMNSISSLSSTIFPHVVSSLASNLITQTLIILSLLFVGFLPLILVLLFVSFRIYPDYYVKPAFSLWRYAVWVKSLRSIKFILGLLCSILIGVYFIFMYFSLRKELSPEAQSNVSVLLNTLYTDSNLALGIALNSNKLHNLPSSTFMFSFSSSIQSLTSSYETLLSGGFFNLENDSPLLPLFYPQNQDFFLQIGNCFP
ncbi:hypothetical protein GEMRC1_004703 [Eukaryota sp. GEM-RC1]